jgi:hypothetical protein
MYSGDEFYGDEITSGLSAHQRNGKVTSAAIQSGIDYVELFSLNGTWMARHASEPMKSKVLRLFGTNELPTPFMSSRYSFREVVTMLQPHNQRTAYVEASR